MMLKDFNETYAHRLRNPDYLNAYLEACLEEGPETFYTGLRKAVQAHEGGFTWLAATTGMGRVSLYKALRPTGNPSFKTIYKVLAALGANTIMLIATPAANSELNRAPGDAAASSKEQVLA